MPSPSRTSNMALIATTILVISFALIQGLAIDQAPYGLENEEHELHGSSQSSDYPPDDATDDQEATGKSGDDGEEEDDAADDDGGDEDDAGTEKQGHYGEVTYNDNRYPVDFSQHQMPYQPQQQSYEPVHKKKTKKKKKKKKKKHHGGYDDHSDDDDEHSDHEESDDDDHHHYGYKPKIKPKVIIVKKLIPLSTTTSPNTG